MPPFQASLVSRCLRPYALARLAWPLVATAVSWTGFSTAGGADPSAAVSAFIAEADAGRCIEDVVYRRIESGDAEDPVTLVKAATLALGQRVTQQRELGCDGDIAAQAIAAGADPQKVLEATAAGL
jgi:hypothetical protein